MNKVEIYSSDTCINCIKAKEYLEEIEVNYIEYNISRDLEAKRELISMGYMSVPLIVINGEHVLGFDKKRIDDLLD
ncbi:glutaredoxin family protein [Romboutsia ilealis]|uniref:Glutaredoxin family protein n=1 Tax=Romboutsia faecis TaxID=2764597 RepID=A0ABR7JTZ1_9FIRM|nr:glutaredoxin family protein [Romboutsia faecis]MBC5998379.1 glutaredoxin family protein [Romboutsia faecis]MRN26248.1 glutaredoxin family protein [Romboutsia ilealis]